MKKIINKIPLIGIPDKPIVSLTQDFLPIADITDNLVLLKNGGAVMVLESSSINFSLLSEKEQQAIIYSYAALLNSLSFPIQIVVRSQIKDISKYMSFLEEAQKKITNPKLAYLMENYKNFVRETIKNVNILGKTFYIALPFSPYETGVTKSIATTLKKNEKLPFSKQFLIQKAKISLYPKRDHIIRQGKRLGLTIRQLSNSQLINLFYNIFNAEAFIYKK